MDKALILTDKEIYRAKYECEGEVPNHEFIKYNIDEEDKRIAEAQLKKAEDFYTKPLTDEEERKEVAELMWVLCRNKISLDGWKYATLDEAPEKLQSFAYTYADQILSITGRKRSQMIEEIEKRTVTSSNGTIMLEMFPDEWSGLKAKYGGK